MVQSSKRDREAQKKVDASKRYPVAEAVAVLKSFPPAKFDETVEISMRLGVDVKQPEQMLRGSASLPKDRRLIIQLGRHMTSSSESFPLRGRTGRKAEDGDPLRVPVARPRDTRILSSLTSPA